MLIPYESLLQLPPITLENLMKEFLFTQVEDGSFSDTDEQALAVAIIQCKQALKKGSLIVDYSEDDQSIAIRPHDHIGR